MLQSKAGEVGDPQVFSGSLSMSTWQQQESWDLGEIRREGIWFLCSRSGDRAGGLEDGGLGLCLESGFSFPSPAQRSKDMQSNLCHTEGPSRKEDFSDNQVKGRAEKGTQDLELVLQMQWECLIPGELVKALHVWGPFMGCDVKSLLKLKTCTSSADEDAIASHSFHLLSGSIILALWPLSSRTPWAFLFPSCTFCTDHELNSFL